jgi:hypothetical protein
VDPRLSENSQLTDKQQNGLREGQR